MSVLALFVPMLLATFVEKDLPKLFSHRATIEVDAQALPWVSVELPEGLLRLCSPDLSDIRVLDASGQPVAYRIFQFHATVERERLEPARILSVSREKTDEPTRIVERFLLEVPRLPEGARAWTLRLLSQQSEYVFRARIDGLDGQGKLTALVPDAPLFRIPGSQAERTDVTLPPPDPSSTRVWVTLTGEAAGYLSPRFTWKATARVGTAPAIRLPVPVRLERLGGTTIARIDRPRGFSPSQIMLGTSTPLFSRIVRAVDVDSNRQETTIGEDRVFRVPGVEGAEHLAVAVRAATGETLKLLIDDQDSAPLAGLGVWLVMEQPVLVCAVSAEQASAPLMLYFGGGRATIPHYDVAEMGAFETWRQSHDIRSKLGPIEANPSHEAVGALAAFQRAGAVIDERLYTHRRAVSVGDAGDGLIGIPLAIEDAALLRADFGDLRLVDASSRQWPFVLQEGVEDRRLSLRLERREGTRSVYEVPLPPGPLWIKRLTIEPTEQYFSRETSVLGVEESGAETVLASTRLVNDPTGKNTPTRLAVEVHGSARVTRLKLTIEDGQEAPLDPLTAVVEVVVPRVLAVAAPGEYRLLMGSASEGRPQYDLGQAREFVLAVKPVAIAPDPAEENPAYRRTAALMQGEGVPRLALWLALGLAVVVLGGLTLRLSRSESKSRP